MIYFVRHYFDLETKLNEEDLEYVSEYTYHDSRYHSATLREKEMEQSIGMAWHKFKSLGFILVHKFQKLQMKKDVLEFCVFPVLLLGAHTWSLTEKEKKMHQMCQRNMERRILHFVWNRIDGNVGSRKRTIVKDIVAAASSLKWKWGRHVT